MAGSRKEADDARTSHSTLLLSSVFKCPSPSHISTAAAVDNHPWKMPNTWVKAIAVTLLAAVARSAADQVSGSPVQGDLDARANEIVSKMTMDEVLGQMTQINIDSILNGETLTLDEAKLRNFAKLKVGSYLNSPYAGGDKNGKYGWTAEEWRKIITRIQEISMEENGGHPIVFGLDSVHGAVYVTNAVIFGQQINGAATFNPDLVYEMGRITGRDTEAAGVPWIFAPILEISQNPLWARTFETFGEDPYLVSVMGDAVVRGMQSNKNTAACMKHFIGYSKTPTGHDKDGVSMSDFDLLNYFAPPFLAAIKAGAMSAMENYVSINGVPVVSSTKILRDLVRKDMGFEGVVVTDWAEINNLNGFHRVAKTKAEAVRMALTQTSLDMSMVPDDTSFIENAKKMLDNHVEYEDRLRASARRIIKMKLKLGLVFNPDIGNGFHRIAEDGDFIVAFKPETDCKVYEGNGANSPLCARFTLDTGVAPFQLPSADV
ncbi:TPA: LOW QUALITY PROTEIN: hypothetical protein N0F65_000530 [Lagenidium giganteum]|uniref:beta-glucosidase n=1 Tax=Lagenidium giganteum TaxID=4803 RepID=A0AAV2Z3K8_9STRA|nr:TPA: LOW QUALITY PROTEIN: hypothetical protein N0F65_000530 [Lagenidium giganteum]